VKRFANRSPSATNLAGLEVVARRAFVLGVAALVNDERRDFVGVLRVLDVAQAVHVHADFAVAVLARPELRFDLFKGRALTRRLHAGHFDPYRDVGVNVVLVQGGPVCQRGCLLFFHVTFSLWSVA